MWVFFGILIFVFLFFPFFAVNLRYQIGGIISILLDGIGGFSLAIGGIYTLLGVVGIFTRSHNWTRHVILGIVLLWVGSWCTGTVINLLGITIGESGSSGGGYH